MIPLSRIPRSAAALTVLLAGMVPAGCSPQGPIEPAEVGSPDAEVIIDPILEDAIGIPSNRPTVTSSTADGRKLVTFHLQNRTDEQLNIEYVLTFYDAAGVPVDQQSPEREFLAPFSVEGFTLATSSKKAKTVQVQVRPAR